MLCRWHSLLLLPVFAPLGLVAHDALNLLVISRKAVEKGVLDVPARGFADVEQAADSDVVESQTVQGDVPEVAVAQVRVSGFLPYKEVVACGIEIPVELFPVAVGQDEQFAQFADDCLRDVLSVFVHVFAHCVGQAQAVVKVLAQRLAFLVQFSVQQVVLVLEVRFLLLFHLTLGVEAYFLLFVYLVLHFRVEGEPCVLFLDADVDQQGGEYAYHYQRYAARYDSPQALGGHLQP